MILKLSKEVRIGILVILTTGFFIWGYSFLKGKNFLASTNNYYAFYEQVGGLIESGHVMMSGYKVGYVDDIRFMDDLKHIRVRLSVDKRFVLPEGTVARIIGADIMGTKAVELIPGNREGRLKAGDTLIPDIEPNLTEEIRLQIMPLKTRAEDMMANMDSVLIIFQSLLDQEFRENFASSIDNMSGTISSLQRSVYAVDKLLNEEDSRFNNILSNLESVSGNFADSNEDINKMLNNFAAISDSLAQSELLSTIDNLNNVLGELNQVMEGVNRGDGSLGKLISDEDLYNNLESATKNLDLLLLDLKDRPGRYVNFSIFGRKQD